MSRDLVEIFGYSPRDKNDHSKKLWSLSGCPFIKQQCTKHNHDQSIVYGTCSVTSPFGDIIICPNRLYSNDYETIRTVSRDAFGNDIPFFLYNEYLDKENNTRDCVVALGNNSGKEVKVERSLSMDWVLARISSNKLVEYVGIEVQSIDITGNYRDAWHGYKNLKAETDFVPSSEHGLNWANVHKRLIPQIIRKGVIYSNSKYCKRGLYFIVPDIVYKKFEAVIGEDIPLQETSSHEMLTVFTYSLGTVPKGQIRPLVQERMLRFLLDDFSNRFITGPNLPKATVLDSTIKKILGVE